MYQLDNCTVPRKVYMEIVGTTNPIRFDLSQVGSNVMNMEIEKFYYDQGNNGIKMLGIVVNGCRDRFNENMHENMCLRTIPLNSNKIFDYQSTECDFTGFNYNQGSNIEIAFVNRDGGSLPSPNLAPVISFGQNYLLNIVFEVNKQ